ncbi:MAG TPA: thermostable hemolysin [Burkholderiaceae bacterium]|nr:thermostable hemolysin [Burkholderiaceae bacterium]
MLTAPITTEAFAEPALQSRLRVHLPGDPERADVEAFIAATYARHFGARLTVFAPNLVSIREGDAIVAAAGFRVATEALFLERYLDEPIEAMLARCAGVSIARESIVEIGHLSVRRANEGRRLFPLLARHLATGKLQWGVSTVTEELRHLLTRMSVPSVALGVADPSRLGLAASDWGRYFDHRPVVVAGPLALARARLDSAVRPR